MHIFWGISILHSGSSLPPVPELVNLSSKQPRVKSQGSLDPALLILVLAKFDVRSYG